MATSPPAKRLPLSVPMRPPAGPYTALLDEVWESAWLTNHGPLVRRLESELATALDVPAVQVVSSGTQGLELMIRAFDLAPGEIITTPFTFAATATVIARSGHRPVFADIDPATWNLDPKAVRQTITPSTRAILATHVFGNPADVAALDEIGAEHNLPVFYDAAHGFWVWHRGRGLLAFGDAAAISFHATKPFHTGEGGAVVFRDPARRAVLTKQRGFALADTLTAETTNAKMSELHAALGLALLPEMPTAIARRRDLLALYRENLTGLPGVTWQKEARATLSNAAYAAVRLADEQTVLSVRETLDKQGIASRRYFFPSLDTLDVFGASAACPISRDLASRVLCFPLHDAMTTADVDRVCTVVAEILYPLAA